MPTEYAFGSLWAVGDLLVNGEVTSERNEDRTIHLMTTQNVRTADYDLAIDEELPLGEDGNPDPYLGNHTHTHVIHLMFDEDVVRIDRSAHPSKRK